MSEKTTTRTILAALPGWSVAMYVKGGTAGGESWQEYLAIDPIIAWEIEREQESSGRPDEHWTRHEVIPITLEGNMNHLGNPWAIKTPEGKYAIPGDCTLDNEVDALKELRRRHEWRERQKQGTVSA